MNVAHLFKAAPPALAAAALSLFVAACEPEDPETRLKEAAEEVKEAESDIQAAQEDVVSAKEDLDSLRESVDEAEAALAEARKKLRRRQKELAEEKNELHSTASDTAVFRLLQTRLLDEPALSRAAVSAGVIDGHVTLRGEVTDPEHKAKAGTIAAETPGVRKVVNLIDVDSE